MQLIKMGDRWTNIVPTFGVHFDNDLKQIKPFSFWLYFAIPKKVV